MWSTGWQENMTAARKYRSGFTLIELLVVIGILAVLLALVLVAINPARQFAQANDTQRRSDVNAILNAVNQYMAERAGALPTPLVSSASANVYPITSDAGGTGADFCNALVPTYIAQLPKDPQTGSFTDCSSYATQYVVSVASASAGDTPRITVSATGQLTPSILVTR